MLGQTPPSNVPVIGNNAFQNATPEDAAAILGSLTTRSCDIDFWPNVDYLATKSPTNQNTIVNVDLNNDNVWLMDKKTATVFEAPLRCNFSRTDLRRFSRPGSGRFGAILLKNSASEI